MLDIVDEEFRAAVLDIVSMPTRFLVNVSERCQLKCAHCITNAPALTAANTARDMTRAVLDALAPHLAHAAYVGLVHAGEPMLAPMFEPLLEALPESTVVHLLTNGMALTEAKLARILDLGVRSLSFSLDGMTAATNDVLRIGSRVDLLIDRIATSTKLAHERGVRVGVSWVMTRANAGELPSLVRFAKSAQLDWIKLEEMFGHDDLALDRYSLDVAVANAKELAGDLALLDHTRAMTVWRCQLDVDARMKKRATLDDFANRVEINPCRAPWETICIEPNGDVRPLSFHHPIAGNLVDTPLEQLWRTAPVFVEARRTARATRLCGAGPTTCAKDPGPSAW